MEERFDSMQCPICGKEMESGLTIQGYQHPLIWYPGRKALTYGDGVKLSFRKSEKLGDFRRFTSRFRSTPSYFPAWYCETCGLMVTDTKTEMEKE